VTKITSHARHECYIRVKETKSSPRSIIWTVSYELYRCLFLALFIFYLLVPYGRLDWLPASFCREHENNIVSYYRVEWTNSREILKPKNDG